MASGVAVPETTIDEYRQVVFAQGYVRASRQAPRVQTKSEARRMQEPPDA